MLRLLERLNDTSDDHASGHLVEQSVLNYIQKILNTRAASVPANPDLGIQPQRLDAEPLAACRYLTHYLLTNEPRIKHIDASVTDDSAMGLKRRFELALQLKNSSTMLLNCDWRRDNTFQVSLGKKNQRSLLG